MKRFERSDALDTALPVHPVYKKMTFSFVERGSSAVECRVRFPFATVSKIGHFRSLH